MSTIETPAYAVARTYVDGRFTYHASRWEWADLALDDAGNNSGPIPISTECGRTAMLLRQRAVADLDAPQHLERFALTARRRREYCPTCIWTVAVETEQVDLALDVFTPYGKDVELLTRVLPEPLLARRVCEAILRESPYGHSSGAMVQLLAHATIHAPTVVVPEECSDGGCDHERDADECPLPDVEVVCGSCSVFAGSWAGQWQGLLLPETAVEGPCEVLNQMAIRYRVGSFWEVAA